MLWDPWSHQQDYSGFWWSLPSPACYQHLAKGFSPEQEQDSQAGTARVPGALSLYRRHPGSALIQHFTRKETMEQPAYKPFLSAAETQK